MPIKLDKIAVFCLRDEYLSEILNAAFSYLFFYDAVHSLETHGVMFMLF